MANLNSSRSRNLLWLSEQQEKLEANRTRRSPSPNKPIPAPKPAAFKPPNPPATHLPSPLAFSNPIYDEYRGPSESPTFDLSSAPPSTSTSSPAHEQQPDHQQQKRTVKPPSFPVPKPRKSLANTAAVGVLSPKSHVNLKHEVSNSSTSSNTTSSGSSIENYEEQLRCQDRLDKTASDSVHSFLYFEQELPAKMTALINEIETLAESLASSDPEEEETKAGNENLTKTSAVPPVGTFRRKRIQVQKELFKFSFSSGSDMLPSPVVSPDFPDAKEVMVKTTKQNTDSGVFSTGDNEASTVLESMDIPPVETKQKSFIPPSPPPRLPPRKHPIQYQKEPKAIENLAPSPAPSPVPPSSSYSTSTIPKKPPPPIPIVQKQELSPSPQPQTNFQESSNESSSSSSSTNNTSSNDQIISTIISPPASAPKPPQPPSTPLTPLFINSEVLAMEHLHTSKLSLQRSGYLWKTGPNYKSFKYRWCILHRQNLDLADASFSYYFNRSSISASLSGKIMISEIEYVGACETAPAKTRLPKFEKRERSVDASSTGEKKAGEKGGTSSSVVFLEIGVRCRGGRVFLLAARAPTDRQLWLHAFVQALSLHAFKNKEMYAFGFLRAKFTVSSGRWAAAFALLTTDRFLYVFEVEAGSPVRAIGCRSYQVYNLRKTVRIGKLDEAGGAVQLSGNNQSLGVSENLQDCKYGFSVTQNGGRVVYLVADQPEHSARWYRSVLKFWPTPEDPTRNTFEEQYLTRENIPVAVDKCLKFLDTYSTVTAKTFKAPPLFANIEQQHPLVLANSTRLLGELRANAWAVHLLPAVHSAQQVSLLLLLYLRSLAQCILTEAMLPAWMKLAEQLEEVESGGEEKGGGGLGSAQGMELLEAIKGMLQALPPIHYATLRRVVLCLANVNMQYPLSTSLCKALVFSKQTNVGPKSPAPTMNLGPTKAPTVSLSLARTLLTVFIKQHLFLFEVTKEEVDREMHIKRVVHLIINQRTEEYLQAQQQQMMMGMNENGLQNSSYPTNISKPVLPQTVISSSLKTTGRGGGPPLTVIDTKQISSLIIGIKVNYDGGVLAGGKTEGDSGKVVVVNVHLNKETTAADVLDMVLEKSDLKEADRGDYALFEVVCYRRLERLVRKKESVLPIVLSWSNWPSHWCAEASLEVRHGDSLMRGGSLALLHNREKYQHLLTSSSSGVSAGASKGVGGGGRLLTAGGGNHNLLSKRTSQSMKVRPTNAAGILQSPANHNPNNQMLMSVIRYCGQSDTRLAKSILAEFSSGSLFLYCKESHQMIGQHCIEDLAWYVGLESVALVQVSTEDGSKRGGGQQQVNNLPNKEAPPASSDPPRTTLMVDSKNGSNPGLNVAALTIIDRRLMNMAQCKDRLNFGQTLLFCSWNELYQWMRALMAAGERINGGGLGGKNKSCNYRN